MGLPASQPAVPDSGTLSRFISQTGLPRDDASAILSQAGWDFDRAVSLAESAAEPRNFTAARLRASAGRRWLLVFYSRTEVSPSPLTHLRLRDYQIRFELFSCSSEHPAGRWFGRTYGAHLQEPYSYCVVDPETAEVRGKCGAQAASLSEIDQLLNWLENFLTDHRELGGPLCGFEKSRPGDERAQERVTVMFEFCLEKEQKVKRVKAEVGGNVKVKALYAKAASLSNLSPGEFKLVFYERKALVELADQEKTVAEVNCANCLLRVLPR
jgi:hypothetical protein